MRIAIIGSGALGSLFGGLLARSGQQVWLYNCSLVEHVDAIRARGLTLQVEGARQTISVPAVSDVREIRGAIDLLGIFVKAYDTEQAIQDALPLVGSGSWVLSLQNGVGQEEILARYLPKGQILRGVTAQGATLVEAGIIHWAGRGPTRLGYLSPMGSSTHQKIGEIVEVFNQAGIETYYEPEIHHWVWEKLLINAAINPLTTLFDIRNGILMEDPALRAITEDVVRETLPVVAAHGVLLSTEEALQRVEGICQATAQNLSSMLQDRHRSKRTEIEYINGAIAREGQRLGVPTPLNRFLTQLVRKTLPGG
ncbi:MAG: hypothetical protein A2Z21_04185 [Candidatus Fraserbacteria bacterium RBG_16_55_9]|uniref:2-dehydropantoate 2-reductase n=1 Tax=Fraserbacteria sp. (strain RBG_16_55_9) TaxID=1817864 RepID=A0A1F5UNY6_FRAXR|nr:MAG: hypothetical protein A2Z21_04185 [Candidatus Fraserbacteria bacterium RBG_16_55_9]